LDERYYFPTVGELQSILSHSRIARFNSIENRFDCEDFAFGVRTEVGLYSYTHNELTRYAICFGVIMGVFEWDRGSDDHAACFVITAEPGQPVYLIEPREPWRRLARESSGPLDFNVSPGTTHLRPIDQCDGFSFIMF
jgi:hypothetical protein